MNEWMNVYIYIQFRSHLDIISDQHNVPLYTKNSIQELFVEQDKEPRVLTRPPNLPDPNPIEHWWDGTEPWQEQRTHITLQMTQRIHSQYPRARFQRTMSMSWQVRSLVVANKIPGRWFKCCGWLVKLYECLLPATNYNRYFGPCVLENLVFLRVKWN